jgi:NADH-quinone oxidoreductase subunit A
MIASIVFSWISIAYLLLPYLFFAEIILSTKDLLSLTFYHLNDSLFYNEYIVIIIFLFVAIILSVVIILFSYILAVQKPETEKLSTYECGFEPYEDARHTFDVKFYLIAILFIVFDIETMFLIPWISVLAQLDLVGFWSMIDFMFELGIGYVYIYCVGALDIH